MTKLSVNVNKIAVIRNSRGGNMPDVVRAALDIERFGGEGITVHPRPDERHIRRADVLALQGALRTEFNIEGYPSKEFLDLVLRVRPSQVTLVPDKPDQLTSNSGWDTEKEQLFLRDILNDLRAAGIRSSIFIDADVRMAEFAAMAGADRVELYTEPYAAMFNEWWKQLYGESEGKDKKGLFPASVIFSTDLHSLGQFIQDGSRTIFETVVSVKETDEKRPVPYDDANVDGLNFLAGETLDFVNHKAMEGTILAHTDGNVPNLMVSLAKLDEYTFGQLVYFFEKACAISGYMLGVNPFDQPGVESYKKNMFALLGKPGFEAQKAELEKRLNK